MTYNNKKGKVILAGAGPGDPDLITVKAAQYLQQADVVLTDRLVSEEILDKYVHPDAEIIHVCETLALKGVRVIVAGLDMDYKGKPFGPMPNLLAIADYITKLHAICVKCGNIANLSHRKTVQSTQVLLGEKDVYEPLCRNCYQG